MRSASAKTFRGITGHKLVTGKRVIDKVTCSRDGNEGEREGAGERERQAEKKKKRESASSTEVARVREGRREKRET